MLPKVLITHSASTSLRCVTAVRADSSRSNDLRFHSRARTYTEDLRLSRGNHFPDVAGIRAILRCMMDILQRFHCHVGFTAVQSMRLAPICKIGISSSCVTSMMRSSGILIVRPVIDW
jgi:hypothetical protein